MHNNFFRFKQFTVFHDRCAMKVGTDAVLLGAWTNTELAEKILDVGTGSGIIAIMLAQRSEASIEAIEIDGAACEQAVSNADQSPWKHRIKIHHVSLQDFSAVSKNKFDLIVSNPPYFIDSLKSPEKSKNAARHNVTLSHEEFIENSLKLLSDKGRLSVVLPFTGAHEFLAKASKYGLFCNRKTNVKSNPHSSVKRILMEYSRIPEPYTENLLIIGTGQPESYTEDYKALTKEFYLAF